MNRHTITFSHSIIPELRALAEGGAVHEVPEVVSDCLCTDYAVHAFDLFHIPKRSPPVCHCVVWGGDIIELLLGGDD